MSEDDGAAELLFFDTFSHETDTDINLDLVQFPKPVYITQVRIIPLGARVKADFPGGVRLGATNPSKFGIEFFVNDLGLAGASTFEILGSLEYNQNDCIHLECTAEKIPTDGLVLRGWYSTITLAVYGILTNSLSEPIASPPAPCEPSGPEELCNLSSDGINSNSQDDMIKDDWKESIPDESLLAHKSDRDDYDYSSTRDHYQHSSDEEQLHRSKHSTDHTARNRTLSENNDREYLRSRSDREKSTRDWSRSPDYSRRSRRKRSERSRSDAEEAHKWPRTPPPTSIDSPTRPRSPDNLEYIDEEMPYKVKSRPYMRSTESLDNTDQEPQTLEDEDTPGTPGEQFEPILSDDEIIGDDDFNDTAETTQPDEFEAEIEAAAASASPAIQKFDPFSTPTSKFKMELETCFEKELDSLKALLKKYELQTKCESVEAFMCCTTTTSEERENFVYLSEQLISKLAYLGQNYKRRRIVLEQLFRVEGAQNLHRAYRILQIGLDVGAACLQAQPAFKIRHMKIGARLAELLSPSEDFIRFVVNEQHFNLFSALLQLYQQDYMALSIKLMILKAIYALVDTKIGMQHFLNGKVNGYQVMLELLQQSPLTRLKFALLAIVKKLNLYELLQCIQENCAKLFIFTNYQSVNETETYQLIGHAIEQVVNALTGGSLSYQQPRRFLPVSKKFEILPDSASQRGFANTLQAFFGQMAVAESLLLLFSNADALPESLLAQSVSLLETMLHTYVGVDYLVDDCFETTQLLVDTLLTIGESPWEREVDSKIEDSIKREEVQQKVVEFTDKDSPAAEENTKDNEKATAPSPSGTEAVVALEYPNKTQLLHQLQELGVALAYKIQTRYHLDAIFHTASRKDYDSPTLATHLHSLYCQTTDCPGRQHTVEVIGQNNNLQIFMDIVKKEQHQQAQRQLSSPGAKYKSPVLSYAVDMVDCCVRYCEDLDYLTEFGSSFLELAKNHEIFEPSVSAVLQEMFVYLKPLEVVNLTAQDDILLLVEVITRSLEYISTFPGDLIMSLRILRQLVIGPPRKVFESTEAEELKRRFIALQFYAADGVQILFKILDKLCSYFDQPGLHAPTLVTTQGAHCCQIVLPALQILRNLLSYAIQCRDVEYKDLTAIDHLMKTYFLMYYFPANSHATKEVQLAKKEIIDTLLAHTQPNEQDEEYLHTSLWTQMMREILKNIDGPYTMLPGLQVLCELLPLPLPIPLPQGVELLESHKQRLVTERKLWSAHLHPLSSQLAKLIEAVAPTSFPKLADLMARVCWQLADLAPNMTLLISKTLTDMLAVEWTTCNGVPTQQLARLLEFFARLTVLACLKSSTLSILTGKPIELLQAVLAIKEQVDVVRRCQLAALKILESMLDARISLISPQSLATPELNLASALPPKEVIPRIAESVFGTLTSSEFGQAVGALCLRNLMLLTEHDITFYHLSVLLKQKATDFQQWLEKSVPNEGNAFNSTLKALVSFLVALIMVDREDSQAPTIPRRTLKFSASELVQCIGYVKEAANPTQPLLRIRAALQQENTQSPVEEMLLVEYGKLLVQLEESGTTAAKETEEEASIAEPMLPQSEGIVTQYAARPIFMAFERGEHRDQLSAANWLKSNVLDELVPTQPTDSITCDLAELASSCLPPETNLTSDCKRVLHLSASPQSNRERTPTAPCFRTRRVEVEPSTGRPEKKIYVTPVRGRGFPRTPQSRGDLFRSRPPNTSRPPSLHVDDFQALETCGAQPTGPTGYNKIPPIMRGTRLSRSRGTRISSAALYRKSKVMRTSSPSAWNDGGSPHYHRPPSGEHFGAEHYSASPHYSGRPRGRGGRPRPYMR